MSEPLWLTRDEVIAFHDDQLREHGGLAGIRDNHALEAALARPQQLFHYEQADLSALAAAHAHGLAKNHPFNDGNKRVAFVSAFVFLGLNGLDLALSEPKAVEIMLALAGGEMDQMSFAAQLREHTRPIRG